MDVGDTPIIEWGDTKLRANKVLTMIAAMALDKVGGSLVFTIEEWIALNERYGGHAAVLFEDSQDGSPIRASIETVESVSLALERRRHSPNGHEPALD